MDESTSISAAGKSAFVELASDIVSAYVSANSVRPADLPALLADVHAAIVGLGGASASAAPVVEKLTPAQIRKSIKPDALISFIDGKPYKTLKRHLSGNGLTIEEYRERFGLPRDYPSTAASYSAQRSALAKSLGLGNQRRNATAKVDGVVETVAEPVVERVAQASTSRGRNKASEPAADPDKKPVRTRKPKKPTAAR